MKKLSVFLILLVFGFYGCSEDDDTVTPDNPDTFNQMKAEINSMITEMDTTSTTGDIDYDYALMMIPHHQAAIDLAQIQLQHGHHDTLKIMSQEGINAHQASKDSLEEYVNTHTPTPLQDTTYLVILDSALAQMRSAMDTMTTIGDYDVDFCLLTIEHHRSAIAAANLLIQYSNSTEMKQKAAALIQELQQEIAALSEFARKHP